MNKLIIILTISFLSFAKVFGQNWYPVGAEWYFNEQILLDYPAHGYAKFTVEKDTLISSKVVKVISRKSYCFKGGDITKIDTVYLCEENSKVFHWTGSEFKLMYDFTLYPGDTLEKEVVNIHCDSVSPIIVDSIRQIEILGKPLTIQYISYTGYWPYYNGVITDKIIEKIGRIEEFIYNPECMIDAQPWDNHQLRCYKDRDLLFQSDWWVKAYPDAPCDTLIDGSAGINSYKLNEQIQVYPNPYQNIVNIMHATSLIKIVDVYNSIGQLIVSIKPNDNYLQLDLEILSSGIYYVIIYTDNLKESIRLIKY